MKENMIKITGVDLVRFVQKVYDLSKPQGLGFMHYEKGGMSEQDAKAIADTARPEGRIVLSMDYIRGRACKMTVFREGNDLYIPNDWFDHNKDQLDHLLNHVGIAV